jgi:hypothetical protein
MVSVAGIQEQALFQLSFDHGMASGMYRACECARRFAAAERTSRPGGGQGEGEDVAR